MPLRKAAVLLVLVVRNVKFALTIYTVSCIVIFSMKIKADANWHLDLRFSAAEDSNCFSRAYSLVMGCRLFA